jgi:hypothetical protein
LPARQKHQNPHGRFLGEEAENFPSPPHPSLPDDARCASWAATTLAAAPPVKSVTLSAAHPAVDRREEERVNGSRHESVWSLRSVAVHTTEPALGRGFQCCLPATHEAPPVCAAWRGEARRGEAHVCRGHWERNKRELTGAVVQNGRSMGGRCLALPL